MVNAFSLYVLSVCHVCGSYQCPYCPIFSGGSSVTLSVTLFTFVMFKLILSRMHRDPF